MFSRIINFIIGNPILVIIIGGGLFNAAVRIAAKTKEQRVKRDAMHALDRQKQEAMRTGRPMPQQMGQSDAQGRDPQSDRRERIEALRKERMDQLRALREKRAGGAPTASAALTSLTSQSSISQNHPNMPPIPVRSRPRPAQQNAQHAAQLASQQPQRRTSLPSARQTRRPAIVATTQQPQARRRVTQARPSQPTPKRQERKAGQFETIESASRASLAGEQSPIQSARSMLRSRSSIRQAMILREILDTPIALRDDDIASGSLFS